MSALTIYTIWQAGNRNISGWVVGLLNQILWLTFIVTREEYGLLPMTIAISFVYARNFLKWKKEQG